MAKTKTIRVSEEELAALEALREQQKAGAETVKVATEAQKALADAFVEAINRTKPEEKKTILNRKQKTAWTPPDGTQRAKLKRKYFHHGMLIDDKLSNEEIELLNRIKPGHYCENFVRVTVRKDRGIDIDHPVRTTSQRLRLVNQFGIRNFSELLQRIIDEKENPKKYRKAEDADLYDIE